MSFPEDNFHVLSNDAQSRGHEVGLTAYGLFAHLVRYANSSGVAFKSVASMVQDTGADRKRIWRAIRTLLAAGWILAEPRDGQTTVYRINWQHFEETSDLSPKQGQATCPQNGDGLPIEPVPVLPATCPPFAPNLSPKRGHNKEQLRRTSKKNNSSCRALRFDDEDQELAQWIWELIQKILPNHKPPNLDSWANDIRLMRERDNRSPADIRKVFGWANADTDFWQANILSPAKLRKHFDKLDLKRRSTSNGKPKTTRYDQHQPDNTDPTVGCFD